MMPISSFANNEAIINSLNEPEIVKLNKGDVAPFSGGLLPFGTFRRYEEFRRGYLAMQEDWELHGSGDDITLIGGIKKDTALFIVFASAGLFAGGLVSQLEPGTRNTILGASLITLAGSLVILTF